MTCKCYLDCYLIAWKAAPSLTLSNIWIKINWPHLKLGLFIAVVPLSVSVCMHVSVHASVGSVLHDDLWSYLSTHYIADSVRSKHTYDAFIDIWRAH